MRRRSYLVPALTLAGVAIFFCLLVRLLLLRYERGDVYPEYSTLRADPLGTRAYFESAGDDGYPVSRGYTSLHRQLQNKPGSLFYLGLSSYELNFFTKDEVVMLDEYVKNGGRVVITFEPEAPITEEDDETKKIKELKPRHMSKQAGDKKAPDKKAPDVKPPTPNVPTSGKSPPPVDQPAQKAEVAPPDPDDAKPMTRQERFERDELKRDNDEQDRENREDNGDTDTTPKHHPKYERSLLALWGFAWDRNREEKPVKKADDSTKSPDADAGASDDSDKKKEKPEVIAFSATYGVLESAVKWKSALYFMRLEPEWTVLYKAKSLPVMIQRKWGKGDIIVAGDSYFISNEALRNDRRPALLSLLAGPTGSLVFDETHLGTQEQEGVMYLANKYRLEGYLYGMLGVALLFLWRNSVPLVPPRAGDYGASLGGVVSGKDSRSGLVNLLRRNINPREILKASFTEWRRQVTPSRSHLQAKAAEMEAVLHSAQTSRADQIVATYHDLRQINTPSRKPHATKS